MPTPNTTVTKNIKATQVNISLRSGRTEYRYAVTTREDMERLLYSIAVNNWITCGPGGAFPGNRTDTVSRFFAWPGNSYTVNDTMLVTSAQVANWARKARHRVTKSQTVRKPVA